MTTVSHERPLKPTARMTVRELRDEIKQENERLTGLGLQPLSTSGAKADLQVRVETLRSLLSASEDGNGASDGSPADAAEGREERAGRASDFADGGGEDAAAPADEPTLAEVEEREAKALVLRSQPAPTPTVLPSAKEWEASMALADSVARTEFVPTSYRGKPDAVLAAILAGRELGVGPMQALRDIHIIEGRPALAAHLQLAMLRRGGITIVESESTAEYARIVGRRRDTGEFAEVVWTIEEAQKSKDKNGKPLTDKANWRNYPADMLWARCVGRLTRRLGSDLVAGMPYTAEEVADFDLQNEGEAYKPYERGTVRTETKVDHDPVPKTWPEINEWASAYGDTFGWPVWLKQATVVLFTVEKAEDSKKLTSQDRQKLGQKAASVIYAIRKAHDPEAIPPPTRKEIQRQWAKVLDGAVLPGPEWRLAPDEELPSYYEANGLPEPEPPENEEGVETAEQEVIAPEDDVPFGVEDDYGSTFSDEGAV